MMVKKYLLVFPVMLTFCGYDRSVAAATCPRLQRTLSHVKTLEDEEHRWADVILTGPVTNGTT